jgi:hypothetical protein
LRLPQSPRAHQEPPKSLRPSRSHQTPRVTSPHIFTWPEHSDKPCMHLEHSWSLRRTPQWRGRESQMARTHSPSLLGCNRSSEWQRQLKRGRGHIYRPSISWKSSTVGWTDGHPLHKGRIIRSLTEPNIAVEPRNPDNTPIVYTDASSDHPVLKPSHSGRYCMFSI